MRADTFITDNQTLKDLNIPGRYKNNSILSLFNNTTTREGEKLLQAMFDHPLTDPERINERKDIFSFFERLQVELPFNATEFEPVENYLKAVGFSNRLSAVYDLVRMRVLSLTVHDKAYETWLAGVDATVKVFSRLKPWIMDVEEASGNTPYHHRAKKAAALLSDRRLDIIYNSAGESPLSFLTAIKIDTTFRGVRNDIAAFLQELYALDVYITVSGVSRKNGFCYPTVMAKEEKFIDIKELYHPCIPHAVANDIYIGHDKKILFLTGANMAGKSTFMKSFAIAVYLAHMGFPVAAEAMTLSVHDGIYTSINVPDNLSMGYSHFYAEVMRVKHIAMEVAKGSQLLIIFDELFKGTNVKDAYDGTVAIVDAFSKRNGTYIISTHIMEAGETLRASNNNLFFKYLPTIINGTVPSYPYTLADGITDDRQGMMIIRNEGIIDIIHGKVN